MRHVWLTAPIGALEFMIAVIAKMQEWFVEYKVSDEFALLTKSVCFKCPTLLLGIYLCPNVRIL